MRDHPDRLGFLQPAWYDSGLSKKNRPPIEDVYAFADKAACRRHRVLFQGEGRHTFMDRKTVKFNGISIELHVLVIRRVPKRQ